MPLINKLFLLKILLAFGLIIGAVVGVHAVQAHRIPDALRSQATIATEAGNRNAAIRHLRHYLEFRPEDVEAQEQLATHLKERPGTNPSDLILLYDKILRLDPVRHEMRREALNLCLRIGRWTDAETHADLLLRDFGTEADLWQKLAAAQSGLQKSTEARKSYENAVKYAPSDPLPYQRYAQYLWRDLKQPAEAEAVVERLIAAQPTNPDSYLTRAKFDLYTAEGKNAIADLQKTVQLDPTHAEGLILLAEQYQKLRRLSDARDCLVTAMKAHPKDVRIVRALSWLELNRGNLGAAVGVLEDAIDRVDDNFELLVPLGDLLVQLGETARTESIIKKLEAQSSPASKLQVKYLNARVAMRNGAWPQAVELLSSLRTEAASLPGLEAQAALLLSHCYRNQADIPREQETLRLILNKDPNHLPARSALAQSLLNTGQTAEAIREYELAVQSPFANPTTHATLFRLKIRQLALRHAKPEEWKPLERVLQELSKAYHVASPEPALLAAEFAAEKGETKQAATILRAAALQRPGDVRIWSALSRSVADLAGVSAGLGILDEAQAAIGDGPELRLARAELHARDPLKLRPFDPLLAHIEPWSEQQQSQLLFGMVEIFDRIGDEARLIRTYQRIVARRPADLPVWEMLGRQAIAAGDAKSEFLARQTIAKLDASGQALTLLDGLQAARSGAIPNAKPDATSQAATCRAAVVKAFSENPNRADACLVLAKLSRVQGDRAEAGRLLERAVRLEPSRFAPMQAYLAHLLDLRATDAVDAVLARLASDPRWHGEPMLRIVDQVARQAVPEQAAVLLAQTRPYVQREPNAMGRLGDLYAHHGMKKEAGECYQLALATPTANADDWLRLAIRTAESGAPDQAIEVLTLARKKLPKALDFPTVAAFVESPSAPKKWLPKLESDQDKRQFAQARLALKLSRFQSAEAAELLETFLADGKRPKADEAWASRNLAMLLAVRGTREARERAMKLLLDSSDDPSITAEEKRASAAVFVALAKHLDGADRKAVLNRAVANLDSLVEETRSPRDAFLLAQVHRSLGNRKASTAILNQLLTADPKNLEFHLMALEELTEMGNFAAAEPFAQRLLALAPQEYRAVAAVARYEAKAGHPEKVLALTEAYVRTADAFAGDLPTKSAHAAELLDEIVRMPKIRGTEIGHTLAQSAISRYEALIVTRPEAVIAAAGLLAFDDRHAEAFTLIEKHAARLPARTRAAAGLAALRSGGASQRQFATVRAWLDAARAEEPGSLALRLNEGEFFALSQDYPSAKAAYQAVLQEDPRNIVALNNLAWILAPDPASAEEALALVDRAVSEVGLTGELLDTRARIRIAAKQFDQAEADLLEALTQGKTPLRMFHLAMAKSGQPDKAEEAHDAFQRAKDRGLEPRVVHPADLPMYRVFETDKQ